MQQYILLNPGPVNVSPRVRRALLRGDICHREEEFSALLVAIRAKLVNAFAPRLYTPVVLSGSGTLAVEAMISSSVPEGKKLLVINNGVYGDRMLRMARAHRIPALELAYGWTERPNLEHLERALKQDTGIGAVALVHHETTTGMLNPVADVGAIARRHGRLVLLDAVSALGGEALDLERSQIDVCAATANKCVQGLPGVSFVLARSQLMEAMRSSPPRSLYLHLPVHWEAQERQSTPFTPAVQAWYALDAALDELLDETVAGRIRRYGKAAAVLRRGFADAGLEFLLPEAFRANSLTALRLPRGVPYRRLHDQIKARGFVIYEGQGKLQTGFFRVANMGHVRLADYRRFVDVLGDVLGQHPSRPK